MNSAQAKRILCTHRPSDGAALNPDLVEALAMAQRNPALAEWWKRQQAFHAAMIKGFSEIPVPAGLRDQIRARPKIISLPWWRKPQTWAAAAAIVLLIGLSALLWKPAASEGTFQNFRSRMVRSVLRQYRMDIQTNDLASIQRFLAAKNAPAEYKLPPKLTQFPLAGGGVMSWQASRASMVCFDTGTTGTAFLFVVNRSDVEQPPARTSTPQVERVSQLMTASWTEGENVYVLAFEDDPGALKKFF